jgi:hypothetical protein
MAALSLASLSLEEGENFQYDFVFEQPFHMGLKKKIREEFSLYYGTRESLEKKSEKFGLIHEFVEAQSEEKIKSYVLKYGVTRAMKEAINNNFSFDLNTFHLQDDEKFFKCLLFVIVEKTLIIVAKED